MSKPRNPALSSVLPPLIFGTATFNVQYNENPYALDTVGLVKEALHMGIRAFDTSPYYGPSEALLGAALTSEETVASFCRQDYILITKVGRIESKVFDFSSEWVAKSVARSLKRLRTDYIDVVCCHDVEFVSPKEVMEAIVELRRIRDEEHTIKYIGISGYPIGVLCEVAERVLAETGEPLDLVLSYANFTLQNTSLVTCGLPKFKAACVNVVANGSPLALGLLRQDGIPPAAVAWHPAPDALRDAVQAARNFCDDHCEKLEDIALRYALEAYIFSGALLGASGDSISGASFHRGSTDSEVPVNPARKLGVTVIGVSNLNELKVTLKVWRSILDGMEGGEATARAAGRWARDHEWSMVKKRSVRILADGIQEILGEWVDYAWESPPSDVNDATSMNQLPFDQSVINSARAKSLPTIRFDE